MLSIQLTNFIEAGTDEAGRGCLAGPVTAAAVILPQDLNLPFLNDSKKLTEKQRNILRPQIENQAIAFSVAHVFQEEIDRINILKASIKAMHLALEQLQKSPEYIVVDGNKFFSFNEIPHQCIVKGDGKFQNIAAASVLAKTYRDDYMKKNQCRFPSLWLGSKQRIPNPVTPSRHSKIRQYPTPQKVPFNYCPRQLEIDF